MYIRRALAAALVAIILSGIPALADYSDALYRGTVTISNTGAAVTGVVTRLDLNTDAFIDAGILDATFNDAWFTNSAGNAMAFMPNPTDTDQWYFFYPWSLPATTSLSYLYMGGPDMTPPIRYFPGAAGFTVDDAAGMEVGDEFEITLEGYIDTDEGTLIYKGQDFGVTCDSGTMTAWIDHATDRTTAITPATGSWQDVDVSAYVPTEAAGIIVEFVGTAAQGVALRPNGSADAFSAAKNTGHSIYSIGIDENDVFEAYINSGGALYLIGYTTAEWVYLASAVDKSTATTATWVDVDVSANVPAGADAAIVDMVNTTAGALNMGLRPNGSAVDIRPAMNGTSHTYAVIPLDAGRIFEQYVSANTVDCYLVGYITDGFESIAPVDKSLAGTGAYADIDCSAEAPGAIALYFHANLSSVSYSWALRCDADPSDYYGPSTGLTRWPIVACSADGVSEGKISNAAVDWTLDGYFTSGIIWLDTYDVEAVAVVASGSRDITVSADGTNLYLYVDGALEASDALGGETVTDNGSDWTYASGGACPYLEALETVVGGVTVQTIDFTVQPVGGVYEDSTGTYDANPSYPTASSDPDVTATLSLLLPLDPAEAPGTSTDSGSGMAGGLPDEPDNLFGELDADMEDIPGVAVVNAILDAGDIPRALFWFLFVFAAIVVLCLMTYHLSRSLMAMSLVAGAGMLFASKIGIVPYWVTVPLVLIALAVLVKEKMSPL